MTWPPPSHLGWQARGGAVGPAGYGCGGPSGRCQHELLQWGQGRREADVDGSKDGGAEWARASTIGTGRGRRRARVGAVQRWMRWGRG